MTMIRCKTIADFSIGDTAVVSHTITHDDVMRFAELSGDRNPLHLDADFASETDMKKPVVYGMLSASFISTLIGMKLPGPGALWTSQTLEFLRPTFVGDTINVVGRVKQISEAANSLVLDIKAADQNGQDVLKGEAAVQLLKADIATEEDVHEEVRVCLITGGTSGIGSAAASLLAESGYTVALNYRKADDKASAIAAASGGKVRAYKADISDAEESAVMIRRIIDELGPISSVVHCAAPRNVIQPFEKMTWRDFDTQISGQVRGLYNIAKVLLPQMAENGVRGKVVVVSSIASDDAPPAGQSDYVVAKAALSALARSLAVEYGPKGIAVSIVSPGMTETERIFDIPQKAKLSTKMQSPSRALVKPREVASCIRFLLDANGCSMAGETLRVCGGIRMI